MLDRTRPDPPPPGPEENPPRTLRLSRQIPAVLSGLAALVTAISPIAVAYLSRR